MGVATSNNWLSVFWTRLHLWVVICCILLVCTSPWVFMARSMGANASFWDYLHVYLGLVCALLGLLFLLSNTLNGNWRTYFGWALGDGAQVKADLVGLTKGKLPITGGKGVLSAIEGLGMLLLLATGLTGVGWFVYQGTPISMEWRGYHQFFAQGFIGFLILHMMLAATHIIEFIRQ
ncbi:MAG: cytochrome b/b6 domain-containing protein [Shewanella sp.]